MSATPACAGRSHGRPVQPPQLDAEPLAVCASILLFPSRGPRPLPPPPQVGTATSSFPGSPALRVPLHPIQTLTPRVSVPRGPRLRECCVSDTAPPHSTHSGVLPAVPACALSSGADQPLFRQCWSASRCARHTSLFLSVTRAKQGLPPSPCRGCRKPWRCAG